MNSFSSNAPGESESVSPKEQRAEQRSQMRDAAYNSYCQAHAPGAVRPKIRFLVASIIYFILIFVVIYGMSNYVYDGFSPLVPWLIIIIFVFMSAVRMRGFLKSVRDAKSAGESESKKD